MNITFLASTKEALDTFYLHGEHKNTSFVPRVGDIIELEREIFVVKDVVISYSHKRSSTIRIFMVPSDKEYTRN